MRQTAAAGTGSVGHSRQGSLASPPVVGSPSYSVSGTSAAAQKYSTMYPSLTSGTAAGGNPNVDDIGKFFCHHLQYQLNRWSFQLSNYVFMLFCFLLASGTCFNAVITGLFCILLNLLCTVRTVSWLKLACTRGFHHHKQLKCTRQTWSNNEIARRCSLYVHSIWFALKRKADLAIYFYSCGSSFVYRCL